MNKTVFNFRLAWRNGIRYLPLLKNLIGRELKKKYRSSVLGYAWCILNPLLIMLIMTAVFSSMFRNSIDNYPVYLFIGRMFYTLITGCGGAVLRSITANGSLMRKTRIPYYIFPLATFCSGVVDFLFNLAAFAIVLIVTGTPVTVHVLAFPLVLLEAFLMTFGIGMLLSVLHVFLRDVNYIWGVFCTAWMYLSALFYPVTSLPNALHAAIRYFNPLYFLIEQGRDVFLYHVWPDPLSMLRGYSFALVMCLLSAWAYLRTRDDLILYV